MVLPSEVVPEPVGLAEPIVPNERRGARGVIVAGVVAGVLAAGALAFALLNGDGSDGNGAAFGSRGDSSDALSGMHSHLVERVGRDGGFRPDKHLS